jgi:transcriptional/translational regulatory protein YebC/TACO1
MFDRKGIITIPAEGKTEDDMMEIILDAGADDLQSEEGYFIVQTAVEDFETVRKALIAKNIAMENASLQWVAKNTINVGGEDAIKLDKLIEALEDHDDAQNVFHNAILELN